MSEEAAAARVAELFGEPTGTSHGEDVWRGIVDAENCPFTSKRCFKVRKSDPETAIGTCVVRAGAAYKPLVICPNRLLAGRRVFADILPLMSHDCNDEHHIVPEFSVPGGTVDFLVVAVSEGNPVDFVGVELQALDTTGTVWPHRQDFLVGVGALDQATAPALKPFGINWKMTAKTILVQLHHKTESFEALDRKLVLVLQQDLMDYMTREFSFGHLADASQDDALHFHPYRLVEGDAGLELQLGHRKSTDAKGIAAALRLGEKEALDDAEVLVRLGQKISSDTLWRPASEPVLPPLPDRSTE